MSTTDNSNIDSLRQDYKNTKTITPNADPFAEFNNWFQEALDNKEIEPNAMSLATVNEHGVPHTRIVLLKGLKDQKFIFFTNYNSTKAQHIEKNANVSLTFWWKNISRAINIQGVAEKIPEAESIEYFNSRPKTNKIGAIVSNQSQIIDSLEDLISKAKIIEEQYKGKEDKIPKPKHWGGYSVKPFKIEFWKGMTGRLHERLRYTLNDKKLWVIEKLAP